MTPLSKIDIHIVCFDVPLPANYGGVIDVFNRLKSLHKAGLKIALHCFEYGRGEDATLQAYCKELHYYQRNQSMVKLLHSLPFIVASRNSALLIRNLLKDQAPILFEGHHSCFYLNDYRLKDRLKWVRTHNVEQDYYRALAKATKSWFKKFYYRLEARKIERFEPSLGNASKIFAISKQDVTHFSTVNSNAVFLPAFHSFKLSEGEQATEEFALYHGNLAVEENNEAALFLVEVFASSQHKLVIAGRKPSSELIGSVRKHSNIEMVENPVDEKLSSLIRSAKINCLYTQQATGVKLKLIRALIEGNSILVNSKMVMNSQFDQYCILAETQEEWRAKVNEVFASSVDSDRILERRERALQVFDNQRNAQIILEEVKK